MGLDMASVVSPAALYPPASGEELDETGQFEAENRRLFLSRPATWKSDGSAYSAFNPDTIGGGIGDGVGIWNRARDGGTGCGGCSGGVRMLRFTARSAPSRNESER